MNGWAPLCIAAADEHASIREWILYHHMLGVGKFYIYDDFSFPPMSVVLEDLIQAGLVKYRFMIPEEKLEIPGRLNHDSVFNTCLHQYGSNHTFLGALHKRCLNGNLIPFIMQCIEWCTMQ